MSVDAARLQLTLGLVGDPGFDTDRATDLLDQINKLVIPITGPTIPDAADPIILSALARAYLNPTNATQLGAGPFTASFPAGGVYLTKAERGALQRAIGQGNYFAIEALPAPYWGTADTTS
jgi:hypothetical protein